MKSLEPVFRRLFAEGAEGIHDVALACPILFTEDAWEQLRRWGRDLSLPESAIEVVIGVIEGLRSSIRQNELPYPFGPGPIDSIWVRSSEGEISFDHALELARSPEVYELLDPLYVACTSNSTGTTARGGDWRIARDVHELLLAAMEARATEPELLANQAEMWLTAAMRWLYIVPIALIHVPDGRVLKRAISIAEGLLKTSLPAPKRGEVMSRLGVIHLDPYFAKRDLQSYDLEYASWQQALVRELGPDYQRLRRETAMPKPEAAVAEGESWLRRAAAIQEGADLGLTLKALANAVHARYQLGWSSEIAALPDIVEHALSLLDPSRFPTANAELELLLAEARRLTGADQPQTHSRTFFDETLPDLIRQYGPLQTAELFRFRAQKLPPEQAERALALWPEIWKLLENAADSYRSGQLNIGIRLIRDAWAEHLAEAAYVRVDQAIVAVFQTARGNGWTARKTAATLLWLVFQAGKRDEEETGLTTLLLINRIDAGLVSLYEPLCTWLCARLQQGMAVNHYREGRFVEAAAFYWHAVASYLEVNLTDPVFALLTYINDLAKIDDPHMISRIVTGLYVYGLFVEEKTAGPGADLLNAVCQTLMLNAYQSGRVIPETLSILWQSAKGLSFGAMLNLESRTPWQDDPELSGLLESILRSTPQDQLLAASSDEVFLTAYYSELERESGSDPAQVRANLQRRFEQRSNMSRISASRPHLETAIPIADVQAAVDPETVLLNYFIGVLPNGSLTLSTLLLTRETVAVLHGLYKDVQSNMLQLQVGEQRSASTLFGLMVAEARRLLIFGDPGNDRAVTPEAAALLKHEFRNFFGGTLTNDLSEMKRAGKKRICIVPHGPLHYFPFHLLMNGDSPLAQDWLVTYLPNLRLVDSSHARRNAHPAASAPEAPGAPAVLAQRRELTVLGLDFAPDGPLHLPELYGEPEARTIAGLFKVEAVTGSNATEEAFREALANSKRVHLSTHGRHCVAAPSFQTVFFSPGTNSDGRLHAFELAGLDLRGLELVTLSACETALGRFDIRDNLRGLPANLLLAGVRTIVGTLWNTENRCARYFFRRFYQATQAGAAPGEAFASAQRDTRVLHPQFRDWGAFYLMGDVC